MVIIQADRGKLLAGILHHWIAGLARCGISCHIFQQFMLPKNEAQESFGV
jgi:hypothetical protein